MPLVKNLEKHKVILDTHVFYWQTQDDPILGKKFRKEIERLVAFSPVMISPISIWEIGMLVEKRRIHLAMDCLDWIEQALQSPYVQLAPFTPQVAVLSSRLPGLVHGDPADRILIATAFEQHAVLVTCDEKILEYGNNHFVNVHDPRE